MSKVSFFTPISFGDQPKNAWQTLLESVDDYFYLGGKKACVIDIQDPEKKTVLLQKSGACLTTCLKIASYFTLVLPLLLLLAKLLTRATTTYSIDDDLQARLSASRELNDFYEVQGILRKDNKPIRNDIIDSLGLDLEETLTVPPELFNQNTRPLLPPEEITLRDATIQVITRINTLLHNHKQAAPDAPLASLRHLYLNTDGPWANRGSNLYFYSHSMSPEGADHCENSPLWLDRIITALVQHKHLFQVQAVRTHGYYLQA